MRPLARTALALGLSAAAGIALAAGPAPACDLPGLAANDCLPRAARLSMAKGLAAQTALVRVAAVPLADPVEAMPPAQIASARMRYDRFASLVASAERDLACAAQNEVALEQEMACWHAARGRLASLVLAEDTLALLERETLLPPSSTIQLHPSVIGPTLRGWVFSIDAQILRPYAWSRGAPRTGAR